MKRAFALLALASACAGDADRVEVGRAMPAYSASTLSGDSISLADRRGKVVLLNVWATWCHPCRAEIPELVAMNKKYGARGLEIIGVSVDAAAAEPDVRAFMKDFTMDYTIWLDPADRVSTRFLLVGVPTTFLIDRAGVLRWRKTGPIALSDTAMISALERALGT